MREDRNARNNKRKRGFSQNGKLHSVKVITINHQESDSLDVYLVLRSRLFLDMF